MQVTIHQPVHEPICRAITDALYGSGLAAFSPASLFAASEEGAWYDFSDLSTLFQDSAGTVPVTADGDLIGKVLDKSGNGNHLTQATSSLKPEYKTSGGLHWALFDGVDDGLASASIDFTATDKMGVFTGAYIQASSYAIMAELSASTNINGGSFYIGANLVSGKYITGLNISPSYTYAEQSAGSVPRLSVHTAVFDGSTGAPSTAMTLRDGGAAYSPSFTGSLGTASFGNYPLYVGRRGGASLPFTGQINQLVVLGRTPTAGEITSTESYIATKTGVTL